MKKFNEYLKENPEYAKELVDQSTYREFLNMYFTKCKELWPSYSYTVFARKAELSSKSLARDVVLGQKRITSKTIRNFINGLEVPELLENFFFFLVAKEEKEIMQNPLDDDKLENRLMMAKLHFLDSYNDIFGAVFYDNFLTPFVTEAITMFPKGAYIEDIYKVLDLPTEEINSAISELLENKIVFEENRLYQVNSQVQFIDQTSEKFKKFYKWELDRIQSRLDKHIEEEAFFNFCFSIKPEDMPAVREELKKALTKFIIYRKDGTQVVSLSASLTRV